jgi:hypothetical protein
MVFQRESYVLNPKPVKERRRRKGKGKIRGKEKRKKQREGKGHKSRPSPLKIIRQKAVRRTTPEADERSEGNGDSHSRSEATRCRRLKVMFFFLRGFSHGKTVWKSSNSTMIFVLFSVFGFFAKEREKVPTFGGKPPFWYFRHRARFGCRSLGTWPTPDFSVS